MRGNLRILCVRLGVAPRKIGGGMRRLIDISRHWECSIFVVMHKQVFQWLNAMGLRAKPFYLVDLKNFSEIFSPLGGLIRVILAKRKNFPLKQADVICSLSHYLFDFLPSIILKKRVNAKLLVVYVHHLVPLFRKQNFFRNMVAYLQQIVSLSLIKKYSDLIFVLSKDTRNKLVKIGIPAERIFITHNGVDLDFIKKSIKNVDGKEFEGCFVGRLTPVKGVVDLIEIWKVVCDYLPDSKLVIVGTGEKKLVAKLKEKIEKYGLSSNISFLGFVSEEQKYRVLKKSKLFLFPSHEEGWGIAVLEAMGCGLPVVAYDIPPFREIYGEAITLVKFKDFEKFGQKVVEILNDNKFRSSLSIKSNNLVYKYDWKKIAIRELEVIKRGLEND